MVTLRTAWDNVIAALQNKAVQIGIPADRITKGIIKFDPKSMQAEIIGDTVSPCLIVFVAPSGGDNTESGATESRKTDIAIYCSIEPSHDVIESYTKLVELEERIQTVLAMKMDYTAEPESTENAIPTADSVTGIIIFTTERTPSPLLEP